jgi:leader peptidase (prepilin peptidase)/N-methyltransferase
MLIAGLIIFILGAIIGSFLNMLIWRLPRDESIIFPRSHCPSCNKILGVVDLIPLLSYIFLGGKCRHCKVKIPIRYFLVELITSSLFILIYLYFGLSIKTFFYLIFISMLIAITFIDFEHYLIFDVISVPGIILGLIFNIFEKNIVTSLIGAFLGGIIIYLIITIGGWIMKKEVMGEGDIKLAAMIGAFLGWQNLLAALFLSFFSGAIVGLALIALDIKKRTDYIPFGPYLALGGILILLWGNLIINWYSQIINY